MRNWMITSGAMLMAGAAMPVWAQDVGAAGAPSQPPTAQPPAAQPPAVEPAAAADIIVTAQKRSERLQEVPVAVSVVNGDALASQGKSGLEGAVNLVPALNFQKSGTTLNQSLFLRGVGTATFSIAGEPSVSTIVDGVVYSRGGEAFSDLIDVEQLEVLRGPQGTLYGKNASAGVINIRTKQPTADFGGYVEGSFFTKSEVRLRGAVNVPLSDTLRTRISGFYGSYDGNIANVALNRTVNGYKHYGGRLQIGWQPSSATRLMFIADYHHNDDSCCAEVIGTPALNAAGLPIASPVNAVLPNPSGDRTRAVNTNLVTATKETGYGFSLQGDFELGSQTVTSITAYRNYRNTEIRDGDFLPSAYVGFPQIHDIGPQIGDSFSQEIRLTSPVRQFVSYVIGAYYSRAYSKRTYTRDDITCNGTLAVPSPLVACGSAGAPPSTFPTGTAVFGSTFKNMSLFGDATMNLSRRLRLIGGLRYSSDQLDVFHARVTANLPVNAAGARVAIGGINPDFGPFNARATNSNLSGRAAVQYDFSHAVTGYASYTRGYKGPAYNVFFGLTATGTNQIAPETSNAYEIGLKNTLFGGRLVLNADVFLAKYDNFQANNPDLVAGVVVSRFTNAGKISTRGAEVDFTIRPVRDLSIAGGGAYTDAHVDAFLLPPGAAASQIIPSGTPLQFAPRWKGSASVDYRWRTGGAFDLFLGAQGNYQSSQLAFFVPDPVQRRLGTIGAYGIVNLSAGIGDAHDKYRLTFQVRNLLDQSYAAAIQSGGPAGSYRYQIPRDANRYFGVTARANF